MERVLPCSKFETVIVRKICTNTGIGPQGRRSRRFSQSSCSSNVKASYSVIKTATGNLESVAPKKFTTSDLDLSIVNGFSNAAWKWTPSTNSYILEAEDDEYGGIIVNPERLPSDTTTFARSLRASLYYWKLMGRKGVWLKLPLDLSDHVPIAVKEGFKYHHAEQSYLMLTYWIPEGPCMLPANASHQVGVGGFVINDQMEVLVVQEKYCAEAFAGSWKLPTGFIHESEEIFCGAVREVKEETGINTEFVEVVAFRHAHHLAFEKSDLFFICMLKPLSNEIKIDDMEIQAAKWMPLAEFVEQPFIQDDNMFKKIIDICIQRLRKRYCGLTAHQVISKFDGRPSCLYYNVLEPRDFNCCAD